MKDFKINGFTWQRNHDKKESWRLELKDLTIHISNGNAYQKGWHMNCRELALSYVELKSSTKEEAAGQAIQTCRERIRDFSSVLKVN